MKRIIKFILVIAIVFNLTIVSRNNVVNAVEPDVIWLENEYDWIDGFNISGMGGFSEGMANVGLGDKMGYINREGKEVIPLRYDWADKFNEGLAKVAIGGKYGFINKSGKEVVPLKYDWVGNFNEGLVLVRIDEKYGYIDKTGKEIIPLKYDWGNDFNEGLAVVGKGNYSDMKYGYIDKIGKEVIPIKYEWANSFSESLAEIKIGNYIGFINKNDKLIIPAIYKSWYDEQPGFGEEYMEGICAYEQKEIIALEDRDGTRFKEGLAMVGVIFDEYWPRYGYIDKNNNFIIPPIYDDVSEFSEGLAIVNNEDINYGYIDKIGKEVIFYNRSFLIENYNEGLVRAMTEDNYYGYVDKTGKEVIPCKYDYATSFNEGLAVYVNLKVGHHFN